MRPAAERDVVPYPPELVEQYRAAGCWSSRTIPAQLRATAQRFPNAPAVATPAGELTYAELDARMDRVAAGLRALGLEAGDRVLLQLNNVEWTIVAWYGLLKANLVPICTLVHHRAHELEEIARQAEPVAHLVQADIPGHHLVALARRVAEQQPSLRALLTIHGDAPDGDDTVALESFLEGAPNPGKPVEVSEESVAVLQLSGGTTSLPKLIPRLHVEYWYNSTVWAERIGLGPGDCVAHVLPVIHNAGIVCAVHAAHAVGACVAVCPLDAEAFAGVARRRPVTHMLLVRPIAQMIAATPGLDAALDRLRVVVWADRKLGPEIRDRYETDTCAVTQMFGMGEGMCMFTPLDAPAEVRHKTNGAPLSPLDEVRVLKPGSEEPVAPGEPGELCCRGPYTIRGYYRAPERNQEAFTSDGFYRTGDIVVEVVAAGGRWYSLEDRLKDLINRGGEKINAAEVEEILMRHPAISQAALVAMPDERLGERACAFVVPASPGGAPSLEDIQTFFEELGVAKFKWPERIEARPALPRTNVQKINKVVLRQEVLDILSREHAAAGAGQN